MKAVLKEDIIVRITERGKTRIGPLISGVGLERQRFDGEKVVDLADLSEMWVRPISPTYFELHAVQVPHSQRLTMTYLDRKRLYLDEGVVKLKTQEQADEESLAKGRDEADNHNLRKEISQLVQDMSYAEVDVHIETVFGNLAAAQKASLKRLYRVVLSLAKKG